MSRAGYEPTAMASFLAKLQADSALQAEIEGHPGTADETDIMSTHPRTADRVQRAIAEAGGAEVQNPMVERELYLGKIDGMLYGDDPKEGLIRDRRFVHPTMRFQFEVPPGFSLYNGTTRVTAIGPENSAILFDLSPEPVTGSLTTYLTQRWGKNLDLGDVEPLTVNGLEAVTGSKRVQLEQGAADIRLVAIRLDADNVYRFIFLTPSAMTDRLASDLQRTTYSFRRLSESEAAQIRPQRLRVVTVGTGDTVVSLARRMDFETHREERFRVLNGLAPDEKVKPGQRVKIVTQ
jgi:predicted Zn-dependent protease